MVAEYCSWRTRLLSEGSLGDVLDREGYEVLEADSGERAFELMLEGSSDIDIIVSDVVLADMRAPELVRKLEALGSRTPIVLMSGYGVGSLADVGDDVFFVRKPFEPQQLLAEIDSALAAEEARAN